MCIGETARRCIRSRNHADALDGWLEKYHLVQESELPELDRLEGRLQTFKGGEMERPKDRPEKRIPGHPRGKLSDRQNAFFHLFRNRNALKI
jgi:hypothetical protein